MKLVHRTDKAATHKTLDRCLVRVEVNNGWEMAGVVSKVSRYCSESKSNSVVVWDSEHHVVLLWFEEEKWATYFNLKGLKEFA